MTRFTPANLDIPIGVVTEETDRGARGLWKDSNHIRFRQGLPEKIGGWEISSFGVGNGDALPADQDGHGPGSVDEGDWSSASTSINLDGNSTSFEAVDGQEIWLLADTVVVDGEVTGNEGDQVVTLDSPITASAGNVMRIAYPAEILGPVVSGTEGDREITVPGAVDAYIHENTIVYVPLADDSVLVTRLSANISSGATVLPLADALPSPPHATRVVTLFVRDSVWVVSLFSSPASFVLRLLNNSPSSSATIILTKPLPVATVAMDYDIEEFQSVTADSDHSGAGTLSINEPTEFSATPGTGTVIVPASTAIQSQFLGFCRALHDWNDLSDQYWLALGTDVKLYLISEGVLFDITPIRDSGTLTDPFETTAESRTVDVTDVAHGAQVGDYVRFSGADLVGDIDLNGEWPIETIVDADTYQIEHTIPATSNDSGGGTVEYEYDIQSGPSSTSQVTGWGTGAYGGGPYGIGQAGVGVERPLRVWSLDNFGEDLLASPNGSTLYHWDRSNGPTIRAVVVPSAPATIQRMLISPQARHVIALGAGTGSFDAPGDPDRLLIRWANQEDFIDWISTSTNLAGDLRLDVGSKIITAIESRGDIIVFTDESLHALNYIGGNFVFALRHLGQSVSIIGPNAAVDVNGIVPFMAEDDFLMYDGVLRVMNCPVRNHVFDDINQEQGDKVYAAVNKQFTEVWWFYPSQASETNDRYVKWNYKDDAWDFGELERTAFHDSSRFLGKPYGTFGGRLFQHETSVDAHDVNGNTQALSSLLESGDMEIDAEGSRLMHVNAMIPDFKELDGSVSLSLRGRAYPQRAALVEKGPYTITSSTERQSLRIRTRQIAFRIESTEIGDHWRMGTWRIEGRPHGRRGG